MSDTKITEDVRTVSDPEAQRSLERAYPGASFPEVTHDKRKETIREDSRRKGSSR